MSVSVKVHQNAQGCRRTELLTGTLGGDELTRQPKKHSMTEWHGTVLKSNDRIPVSQG